MPMSGVWRLAITFENTKKRAEWALLKRVQNELTLLTCPFFLIMTQQSSRESYNGSR
jgi:hypothetical protein